MGNRITSMVAGAAILAVTLFIAGDGQPGSVRVTGVEQPDVEAAERRAELRADRPAARRTKTGAGAGHTAAAVSAGASLPSVTTASKVVKSITHGSPFADGCGLDYSASGAGQRTEDAEVEPDIAVNPENPNNIIVAYSQDLYDGFVVQTTFDGGVTWTEVIPPKITTCSGGDFEISADVSLDFGPGGIAYMSSFPLDAPHPTLALPHRTRLQVSTSTDGGLTWGDPVEVIGGVLRISDRPIITADPFRPGVAYVAGAEAQTALGGLYSVGFARTADGGKTWGPYRPIFAAEGGPNSNIVVALPDGAIVLINTIHPYPNAVAHGALRYRTVAVRSEDDGLTWSLPVTVTEWVGTGTGPSDSPYRDPETNVPVEAQEDNTSVALAPDGTIYVAGRNSTGPGTSEIAVVRSLDGGKTWSEQMVAGSRATQMWQPTIAVAGDGTVGMFYFDHRNDVLGDGAFTTDVWFAESADRGATWSESHLAGPFDIRTATLRQIPITGLFLGDYQGLVGLPDGFAAAFGMSKPVATLGASDIFFGRVTL